MAAAIEFIDIRHAYDQNPVLDRVSLTIAPGTLVGILGPNGAGKSTLMKIAMGLLTPLAGTVRIFGQPPAAARRKLAYVQQSGSIDLDFPVSVWDVVMMGRMPAMGWWRLRPRPVDRERVQHWLDQVDLWPLRRRQIGQLSGGQRQRVFLARALAQEADIFLLDEPFAGVDIVSERKIMAVLKQIRDEGRTAVVILHDVAHAQEHFDQILLLNRRVIAYGPPADVLTPERLAETYVGTLNEPSQRGREAQRDDSAEPGDVDRFVDAVSQRRDAGWQP